MKDYRNATRTISMGESITSPIISELSGTLEDGTVVERDSTFVNYSRGGFYGLANAIGCFELFDDDGNSINNLVDYVGNFHTDKRTPIYDEFDDFIENKTGKKLVSIRGTVVGNTSSKLGGFTDVFKSKVITSIILGDGNIYKIMKDGTCEIVENKDDAKRIF